MRTTTLLPAMAVALLAPLSAAQNSPLVRLVQTPPPAGKSENPEPVQAQAPLRLTAILWDEVQSRAMFRAADADADDRLDLFEAAAALEALESPRDLTRFRKLDSNRDGYLTWSEFDAHFRDVVTHGSSFRVTIARGPGTATPPAASTGSSRPAVPTNAERIVRLWDTDGNGELSHLELRSLLEAYRLGPELAARARYLDLDQSGGLSTQELGSLLQFLPAFLLQSRPADAKSSALGTWAPADQDGDGILRLPEFTAALRRIDPLLAPHAEQLFQQADANHDAALDAAELGAAAKAKAAPGKGPGTGSR